MADESVDFQTTTLAFCDEHAVELTKNVPLKALAIIPVQGDGVKRRAIYELSVDWFLSVLNGQYAFDLPQGAEILGVNVDHLRASVEILCRCDEYDEVPEGAYPPKRIGLSLRRMGQG